jgi:cell division protein FtsB
MAGVMEDALERMGSVIIQYIKAYTPEDLIVTIGEGDKAIKELELNKKNKLNPNNEESVMAFSKAMQEKGKSQAEIEDIINKAKASEDYANTIEDYITNNTSDLDLYVKIVPGSYASMFDSVRFQILTMLAQMGAVHPSVLLDYAPIENREEIKKQSNTAEMAFRQLNEMQQQMEGISKEIEKTKQENVKLKEQMGEVENKARMDYLYKDARVKESKAKADLNFAIKNIKENAGFKSKELILDLKQILKEMEDEEVNLNDNDFDMLIENVRGVIDNNIGE